MISLRSAFRFATRPWRERLAAHYTALVSADAGLTPIHQAEAEDAFLVGYPKSGNTWLQTLMAGAFCGVNPRLAPDALVQELVPDVHAKQFYRRYGTPTFFKSHHLPRPEYRRVVYLLRDGRDVMVSYFHHLAALGGCHPDALEIVRTGRHLFPCKWHEHVRAWLGNPYGASMMVVRYEDLRRSTGEVLRALCRFLGLVRDDTLLDAVVAQASFESMRERERSSGWEATCWPRDRAFVRRGVVGSHRDEMDAAVLEAFLRDARPVLTQAGYLCGEPSDGDERRTSAALRSAS